MYLDYFPLTQSLSSSYNFFNTQILPNLYDNGTSLIQYAKDLYPVELHIHVLSHICSRHRQIALSNNGYKLNILDSVYNQCLGELIAQKLHKIIVNCQSYNKVSVHTPNTTTLLPGSNIFATEQLETALNATHKQLVLALTSHWNVNNCLFRHTILNPNVNPKSLQSTLNQWILDLKVQLLLLATLAIKII